MKKYFVILIMILLTMSVTSSAQYQEGSVEIDATTTFMSTWDTTLISTGSSDSNQIKLPLDLVGNYNFIVDWDDDPLNYAYVNISQTPGGDVLETLRLNDGRAIFRWSFGR